MGIVAKKLGLRIKELRENKKLTQFMLAEMINMEATNLSKIERGVQIPKEESLIKITEALDVTIKDLFDYDHFSEKSILITKITEKLKDTDLKTVQNFYKILVNFI